MSRHKNETPVEKAIRRVTHVLRENYLWSSNRALADRIVHHLLELGWTPPS